MYSCRPFTNIPMATVTRARAVKASHFFRNQQAHCRCTWTTSTLEGNTKDHIKLKRPRYRVTTSSMFIPRRSVDHHQASLRSHKVMLKHGLIRQASSGVYHFLPLGLRALEKLMALVDEEMSAIGARKMAMPILTPASLWKQTGRWDEVGSELFKLKDQKDTEFCLGPTHEESITQMVKEEITSYRMLPLRLYQLDRKFRDEIRPRFGLLRAREFWMKDMYTFDLTSDDASDTYLEVCSAYQRIFKRLNVPVLKVKATTGTIGGSLSHEYHVPAAVGEDALITCKVCGKGVSRELVGDDPIQSLPNCPKTSKHCKLVETKGIEVAHCFYLGTKYSSVFNASYIKDDKERLIEMGCYGLGVSRLLAAVIEYGCRTPQDKHTLVWPLPIAPFPICVAPMTNDTSDPLTQRAEELYDTLEEVFPDDVILEDRVHHTLGARIRDTEESGYPAIILIGEKVPEDKYELRLREMSKDGVYWETHELSLDELTTTLQTAFHNQ